MRVIDCVQGTPEWFQARCGIPSASNFDKIITTKGEPSKQAEKYLYKLAGERVSKTIEESYQNGAMQRGVEMEDEARQLYQIVTDCQVDKVGFCVTDDGNAGCSPDGLVGTDGGMEIKCPNMATHVGYLIDGKLPIDYFQQVQGGLYVTGRKWWDFVSYYPAIKPFIIRVERDEKFITALENELKAFCEKLNEVVKKIGE
jgi:hypothetical protein